MKLEINPSDYLILVCDDEESIRSMLGEVIKEWGFQIATAPNGEAALDFINAGNIPHIILTDIRMGGITGIELAEKAKVISSEIEVIIMTSHGTLETAVQAMRIGVFDYLQKPFENIQDVRSTLIHVAERIYLRLYNEYLLHEIQQKNEEVSNLAAMATELTKKLDIAKTIEIGCEGLSRAFGKCPTVFFQYSAAQKSLMATTRTPLEFFGKTQPKTLLPDNVCGTPESLQFYLASLEKNPQFVALLEQARKLSPESARGGAQAQWKIMPLITRGTPRGVFALLVSEWNEESSAPLLDRYMQTLITAFENALLHYKIVEISITDALTGLFNVRHFRERFKELLELSARLQHPLSLLFFDVDHFKKFNDTNGHQAGDEVLRIMGRLMKGAFRTTDVKARYGGEEFVVLLPHTSFPDALAKAESFRSVIDKHPFPMEQSQPLGRVTASIGVAEFPSHGMTQEALIKVADDALYEAKKKSRNVVVPGVPPAGYVPPFQSVRVQSNRQPPGFDSSGPPPPKDPGSEVPGQ